MNPLEDLVLLYLLVLFYWYVTPHWIPGKALISTEFIDFTHRFSSAKSPQGCPDEI
jgi:hypothetical protein